MSFRAKIVVAAVTVALGLAVIVGGCVWKNREEGNPNRDVHATSFIVSESQHDNDSMISQEELREVKARAERDVFYDIENVGQCAYMPAEVRVRNEDTECTSECYRSEFPREQCINAVISSAPSNGVSQACELLEEAYPSRSSIDDCWRKAAVSDVNRGDACQNIKNEQRRVECFENYLDEREILAYMEIRDAKRENAVRPDTLGEFLFIKNGDVYASRAQIGGKVSSSLILDLPYPIVSIRLNPTENGFVFVGVRKQSTLVPEIPGNGDVVGFVDRASLTHTILFQQDQADYAGLQQAPIFSPDGQTVFFGTDLLWMAPVDGNGAVALSEFTGEVRENGNCVMRAVGFSPTGRLLIASEACMESGTTLILDIASRKVVDSFWGTIGIGEVLCGFTSDDQYVTHSYDDGKPGEESVKLTQIRNGAPVRKSIWNAQLIPAQSIGDQGPVAGCELLGELGYELTAKKNSPLDYYEPRYEYNDSNGDTLWYRSTKGSIAAKVSDYDALAETSNTQYATFGKVPK